MPASVESSLDSGSQCTCQGALKELSYNVILKVVEETVQSKTNYKYAIDKITADVAVFKNGVSGSCSGVTAVPQSYSIDFVTSEESRSRSGNPGYIDGLPVLAGKLNAANYMEVFTDGLSILGADKTGECRKGTELEFL